jgi:hypothetical protein
VRRHPDEAQKATSVAASASSVSVCRGTALRILRPPKKSHKRFVDPRQRLHPSVRNAVYGVHL